MGPHAVAIEDKNDAMPLDGFGKLCHRLEAKLHGRMGGLEEHLPSPSRKVVVNEVMGQSRPHGVVGVHVFERITPGQGLQQR